MDTSEKRVLQPKPNSAAKCRATGLAAGTSGTISCLFLGMSIALNLVLVPQIEAAPEGSLSSSNVDRSHRTRNPLGYTYTIARDKTSELLKRIPYISPTPSSLTFHVVDRIAQQPNPLNSGLDITLTIPQATFIDLLEVVNVELPVPVDGAISSSFQLKGTVTNPILEGSFQSLQEGSIDQVELKEYSGQFTFSNSQLNIRELSARIAANGNEAGVISGSGELTIADSIQGQLQLNLNGVNTEALFALYSPSDSPPLLGQTDLSVSANLTEVEVNVDANWQSTGGTVDWSGTAQLGWDSDTKSVDFDVSGAIEAGTLQLKGQALLDPQQINAEVTIKQLPLQPLSGPISQLSVEPQAGSVDAELQLDWQLMQVPNLTGAIELVDATIVFFQLDRSQTISNLNGEFSLKNQIVQIDKFQGQLGNIPFSTEGTAGWSDWLDWEQFGLPTGIPEESIEPPSE